MKGRWCWLVGHVPYVFHGVSHCARCHIALEPPPQLDTPAAKAERARRLAIDPEQKLEYLIQRGWTIGQVRRYLPDLRRFLPPR